MRKLRITLIALMLFLVCGLGAAACGSEPSEPTVARVTVTGSTLKSYTVGDELNLSGLVVKATLSDETSVTVAAGDYTVSPADGSVLATPGAITVTVTYKEKTGTVTVNVAAEAVESIAITKKPDTTQYAMGGEFNPSGMEITAAYNTGKTAPVSLDDCKISVVDDVAVITAHEKNVYFPLQLTNLPIQNFGKNANDENFWDVNDTNWTKFTHKDNDDAHKDDGFPVLSTEDDESVLKFTSSTVRRSHPFVIKTNDPTANNLTDNIAADIKNGNDDIDYRYSFRLKANGAFRLMLLTGANVKSDLSGSGSAVQLTLDGNRFLLNTRAGTKGKVESFAEFNAADYGYQSDAWNRVDIVLRRKEGKVTMKLYINNARVYFNETALYEFGSFTNGNFVFDAFTGNSHHGHRFIPIPEGSTELYLSTIPVPAA